MQDGFFIYQIRKGGNCVNEGIILAILACVVEIAKVLNEENKDGKENK